MASSCGPFISVSGAGVRPSFLTWLFWVFYLYVGVGDLVARLAHGLSLFVDGWAGFLLSLYLCLGTPLVRLIPRYVVRLGRPRWSAPLLLRVIVRSFSYFLLSYFKRITGTFRVPGGADAVVGVDTPAFRAVNFYIYISMTAVVTGHARSVNYPVLCAVLETGLVWVSGLFCARRLFGVRVRYQTTVGMLGGIL